MTSHKLTYSEKVEMLKRENPKLTDDDACTLLGITMQQLKQDRNKEIFNESGMEILNNFFNVANVQPKVE
jgi:hypothetical protein